jgi:hypothetical protein
MTGCDNSIAAALDTMPASLGSERPQRRPRAGPSRGDKRFAPDLDVSMLLALRVHYLLNRMTEEYLARLSFNEAAHLQVLESPR